MIMKMKHGLIFAAMFSMSVMAQTDTNSPPPLATPGSNAPAAATPAMTAPADISTTTSTNEPVKKVAAKKRRAKKAAAAPAAPLVPFAENDLAVANVKKINVRAQSHINSEVVTTLSKGDTVTVLKQVTLKKPKIDEPAVWLQILLPTGTHVWVNSSFVDATSSTVKPAKLNIRSGPGENYSIIGRLVKGDAVKVVEAKGDWTSIEAPTNAYGFVAAHLLAHKEAMPAPATNPAPPVAAVVENPAAIPTASTENPSSTTTNPPPAAPVVTPAIPTPLPAPAVEEPPAPRIVEREGIVGNTVSIQAPSHFQLESLDNGKVIDYLYSSSTNLDLKRWKGKTVLVSGEEELDERWPNTPVVTIQKIQVVK
jgi:uncharacterized protein YgiM (DUF1202 family)